jgi:hypothetical protein
MVRAHGSKVALVERRDLGLAEALSECHDAGIDDTEREVCVASLQLAATSQVDIRRRLGAVGPGKQIVEKDEPSLRWQATATPVVELRQHQGRDDQVLVGLHEQSSAALVVRVSGVERGQEWTGVADERHLGARLFGDRLRRECGRASAIGGSCYADPWAPLLAQ